MSENILKYQEPSQRRTFRVTAPMNMQIGDVVYKVDNWSVIDFKIKEYTGSLKDGEEVSVYVQIPYQGFDVAFKTLIKISVIDESAQTLAGEFIAMDAREKEILSTFVSGLVRGDMDTVDGVIRRMDIPVTPASLKPDANRTAEEQKQAEVKRAIGSMLYGLVGLILTIALAVVIYTNFFQIKVETAVMAAPTDIIIAPATGSIKKYSVRARTVVEAGQTLAHFVDPELEQNIGQAALKLEEAIVNSKASNQSNARRGALSNREIKTARQAVSARQKSLNVQASQVNRLRGMLAKGLARKSELEKAQGAYYRAQAELNKAMQALNQVSSDPKNNTTTLLSLAEGEYSLLKEQRDRLSVKSAARGRILSYMVREGAAVRYGDPVAIFQHEEPKYIEAYLTRKEALSIAIGDEAEVYFPSHDYEMEYKITDIDYASKLVSKRDGRYFMEQAGKSRDVLVKLNPIMNGNGEAEVINSIIPGTSAVVVFDKPFYR